jgi:serine/threonine-protein kinase HipA
MLSVAALLEVEWSEPSIGYGELIALVNGITRDYEAAEQMYRRMAFNVLAINRDDHTKQFAFLQSREGEWRLAPAYDLTLSLGVNGEHYLAVNGKGRNITIDDILTVGRDAGIKPARARAVVDEVQSAIAEFDRFAGAYDVSAATRAEFRRHVSPPATLVRAPRKR